jgi:predicted ribosomally synthesized peptide with nif11-like leader
MIVMSMTDAVAFLERAEIDDEFAADFESVKHDQEAVLAKVREAGYDATPDEILSAVIERYGVELTPEQLDEIAAGADGGEIAGIVIGSVLGVASVVAVCAAFAA